MNKAKELLRTKRELNKDEVPIQRRYPRPMGLTLTIQSLKNTNDKEQLQKIKENLIEQWILNNMQLNNRLMTINEMSTYLNLSPTMIMMKIQRAYVRMGWLTKDENIKDTARAIFSQAFFGASESVALTRQQVYLMMASQCDEYQPFVSQTVNAALDNFTKSNKVFMGLLELLKAPSNTYITAQQTANNDAQNGQKSHNITTDEAVRIIREQMPSMLTNTSLLEQGFEALKAQESLPDVCARNQDLTSIGIGKRAKDGTQNKAQEALPQGTQHRKRDPDFNLIEDAHEEDFIS